MGLSLLFLFSWRAMLLYASCYLHHRNTINLPRWRSWMTSGRSLTSSTWFSSLFQSGWPSMGIRIHSNTCSDRSSFWKKKKKRCFQSFWRRIYKIGQEFCQRYLEIFPIARRKSEERSVVHESQLEMILLGL